LCFALTSLTEAGKKNSWWQIPENSGFLVHSRSGKRKGDVTICSSGIGHDTAVQSTVAVER
jgi:hypothetical protein